MVCSCKQSCACDKSIEVLSRLLANSYILFLKTQNIHWNVESCAVRGIHLMTEEHYNDLFAAIDVIAERIRMVGGKSPATFKEFLEIASINDNLNAETSEEMLKALLLDHKTIRDDIKNGIKTINDSDDFGTVDVLNSRLAFHEKIIWMLKSTIA